MYIFFTFFLTKKKYEAEKNNASLQLTKASRKIFQLNKKKTIFHHMRLTEKIQFWNSLLPATMSEMVQFKSDLNLDLNPDLI